MPDVPYGYCHCGCGGLAPLAKKSDSSNGRVKGQPQRYIAGHGARKPVQWATEDRGYATPCRIWRGSLGANGYAYVNSGGKVRLRHVVEWEAVNGPVPDGLELDHRCGQPDCSRVDHLEAVTHAENVYRGRKTRLSRDDVRDIRARVQRGASWAECEVVAVEYGIAVSYVRAIVAHARRKNVV